MDEFRHKKFLSYSIAKKATNNSVKHVFKHIFVMPKRVSACGFQIIRIKYEKFELL